MVVVVGSGGRKHPSSLGSRGGVVAQVTAMVVGMNTLRRVETRSGVSTR